jgi:hypothetical protein
MFFLIKIFKEMNLENLPIHPNNALINSNKITFYGGACNENN